MIKNGNYYVVQGWMLKMGLSGTKLQVYAIIYGFTQNGQDEYCGSASYLAEWCGCSKRTIFNVLNELVEEKFLTKTEYSVNGVKFVKYCTNFTSSEKISLGGSEKISPNNIDKENIEKKKVKKKNFVPPTLEEVQEYARQQNRVDLAEGFHKYFSDTKWVDSKGVKVSSWKGKFLTWKAFDEKQGKSNKPSSQRSYSTNEMNDIFQNIEDIDIT